MLITHLESPAVESGSPQTPFNLFDYVQASCLGSHNAVLDVLSLETNQLVGRITIVSGHLWSVEDRSGSGGDAFLRVSAVQGTEVRCSTLQCDPGARNVTTGWEGLLLEAASRLDESTAALAEPLDRELAQGIELATEVFDPAEPIEVEAVDLLERLDSLAGYRTASLTRPQASTADTGKTIEVAQQGADPEVGDSPLRLSAPTAPWPTEPPPERETQSPSDFERAIEDALEASLSKDYEQAMACYEAAELLQPGDGLVRANLERLAELLSQRGSQNDYEIGS